MCVLLCKCPSYQRLNGKHEILTLTGQNINIHTMQADRGECAGDGKKERKKLREKERDRRKES